MAKICGIYKITSPSGKFYIGSSVDVHARWSGHKSSLRSGNHHCEALQRAAQKYGVDQLAFVVLEEIHPDAIREVEQQYIDTLIPSYNSSRCTAEPLSSLWKDPAFRAAGCKRAGERIRALRLDSALVERQRAGASESLARRMRDPEHMARHVQACSIPTINKVNADPEIKRKAADGRRRRYANDPDAAQKRSDLGKELMGRLHADPKFVAEMKVRNAAAMKAMRADPVARAKNLAAVIEAQSKPVLCVDAGLAFASVGDANEWLGVSKSSGKIGMAARGVRSSAYKHTWRFLTKEEFAAYRPEATEGAAHG